MRLVVFFALAIASYTEAQYLSFRERAKTSCNSVQIKVMHSGFSKCKIELTSSQHKMAQEIMPVPYRGSWKNCIFDVKGLYPSTLYVATYRFLGRGGWGLPVQNRRQKIVRTGPQTSKCRGPRKTEKPPTTVRPTPTQRPGSRTLVLKVSERDRRRENSYGKYIIHSESHDVNAQVVVKPEIRRSYLRFVVGCDLEVTRKSDRRRIHYALRAPFAVGRKHCIFAVPRLSPNTDYTVRVKIRVSRSYRYLNQFKRWSLGYYGLKTLEGGKVKPTRKPTREPTRKPTKKTTMEPEKPVKKQVLKVSERDRRRENSYGKYIIHAESHDVNAQVVVKPEIRSSYLRFVVGCDLEVTRKSDRRRIHYSLRAPFAVGRKHCIFTVPRLSPNTDYTVRVKIRVSRSYRYLAKLKRWSLGYYGLKTLEGGKVKPTRKPTREPTRKPTKVEETGDPLGYKMEVYPHSISLVVRFLLTPGSKIRTCDLKQLDYTGRKVRGRYLQREYTRQVREGRCEFRLNVWIPSYGTRKYPPNWVKIKYQLKYPLRVGAVTGEDATGWKSKTLDFYKPLSTVVRSRAQYEIVYYAVGSETKIVVYPGPRLPRSTFNTASDCDIELTQPGCPAKRFTASYNSNSCRFNLKLPKNGKYKVRVQLKGGRRPWNTWGPRYELLKTKRTLSFGFWGKKKKKVVCN